MTIDERIAALTERHEALTMNLELLSKDREKYHEDIKMLISTARQDGENIRGLAHIAELHQEEHKLDRLEQKERDAAMDTRIEKLVSAIGAFIAAQGPKKKRKRNGG